MTDNSQSGFAMVIHVGDIAYAGDGAQYEIEEIWVIASSNKSFSSRIFGQTR